MKILYVIRKREKRHWSKRLQRWLTGFTDGQDGFFEASLHYGCDVTRRTFRETSEMSPADLRRFDAIVVNAKSGFPWQDPSEANALLRTWNRPSALFIGQARPTEMAPDGVADGFDILFKREPFADLDRYELSNSNRAKLVTTLLSNQLLSMSWRFKNKNTGFTLPQYGYQHDKTHDVYFSGKLGPNRFDNRVAAWERVTAELGDLRLKGGLASNGQVEVPAHLQGELMEKPEYLQTLLTTKVNLALSGIGPFTHRHLELFYAGAFALSNNDIEPLWLRAPVVKGWDYAAFDTEDEMIDMIRYYVAHDAEREAIAKNGRACFERLYDVPAHAVELRDALQKVI